MADVQRPVRHLGASDRHRPDHAGQRHAFHPHRSARWHRRLLRDRTRHHHLGLFRRFPVRRAVHALVDPPGRPCACFRGARQLHVGGVDQLPAPDRALGLDRTAPSHRLLHVRCLCDGRKLAERCLDQRDTRQGAVRLYDLADSRDHRRAGPAEPRRSGDLGSLHRRLDPCFDLLCAHSFDRVAGADDRCDAPNATPSPVLRFAARDDRHFPARQRLCDPIGHGCRLRLADRHDGG